MSSENGSKRVLLAAGGTAGHIEPALAVAEAIKQIDSKVICEFIGTRSGLEEVLVPKRGYRVNQIPKVVMPRKLSFDLLVFPFDALRSLIVALRIVGGADLLIGFGGYVSAPSYIAAWLRRIPIVVHEANARPGWANRLGRHMARIVAVNFPSVQSKWTGSIMTGMPIRDSIANLTTLSGEELERFRRLNSESWGFDANLPIVAIFGGSQGSQHINSVVEDYLPLKDSKIQIIHAVGMNNKLPVARPGYLPLSYFHDMAAIYGSADLLITRSGAMTCAELMTMGRSAILIPLAHGNGEQIDNADQLAKMGLAKSLPNEGFDAQWLAANLNSALADAQRGSSTQSSVHLGAAHRLAQLALEEVAP